MIVKLDIMHPSISICFQIEPEITSALHSVCGKPFIQACESHAIISGRCFLLACSSFFIYVFLLGLLILLCLLRQLLLFGATCPKKKKKVSGVSASKSLIQLV
ncbi:hypothetical protein U1Q18_027616 [Sarracenia purpurea var. burkii]